ncbi:hypothetical protein R3P38DRAFT_2857025 [Favolaschia claudopus]|uniref:F-box domain-containing protein n=1 Tax=Favolaschia claudopus TaxID=2862362 RepID=A0AAW0DIF4_9AGAR
MPQQSPLEISELLDRCIDLMSRSEPFINVPDLLACALVARAWVHPAQSRLFHAPAHTNPDFSSRLWVVEEFSQSLAISPHLREYVRRLHLDYSALPPYYMQMLCQQSFTHLESLMVSIEEHDFQTFPTADNFPQPSTLPALRHLSLEIKGPFSLLNSIVQQFPPTVQHLYLGCTSWDYIDTTSDIASTGQLIQLKSARLSMWDNGEFAWFAPHPRSSYPFDFSQLKALAIIYADSIDWSVIPTSRIEILDLYVTYEHTAVDLTAFPMLRILRFCVDRNQIPRIVAETLSTVTSQHGIRTIIISVEHYRMNEAEYTELDTLIASMPMPSLPAVELEHRFHYPPDFAQYFPALVSKNLFRVVAYEFVRECWQALVNQL